MKPANPSASDLIESARQARIENRADDALRDVKQAIALCRVHDDRAGLIAAIKALGHLEADREDLQASAQAYGEALDLARQQADPLVLAHTLRHLGDAMSRLGDTQSAQASYAEALALYQAHAGDGGLDHANALRACALLMDRTARSDEARVLWARARDYYASTGIQAGVDECAARLGDPAPASPG
jgi:tetratricopeptide (TPR) repeat protein